ncbi:carbohydrate ABC transporter permease [Pseudarthrobacter cellobiosi]|uniref:carbohydrate ABC transporter permease n=1 Tax=Pseudarthrobacter cellobiosi TaxID=2953654 RepID=UPI00208DF484|nr:MULTISPECIES: carbohydrate ABC transporter permease [unclassified Pseudarthrobacter]MCO4257057.1 carbohydrate ABC transporter permease [Pseudarthrobacter sp. HLT1-5]MCO4274163.1 carbohydrate ABC transporter permease [Pseudarthrobacter sp. HLT3-5]
MTTTAGTSARGKLRSGTGAVSRAQQRARMPADVSLILIGACFVLPLLWLVFASLDASAGHEARLPGRFSLDNFAAIMTPGLLFQPLWNSMVLSAGTAAVNLVAAVLAAYPLSRYQSRFNKPFMYTVLFGTCLPITAIMVPVYGLFVQLQLLDSMPATIFFMATTTLPMAIWMTKSFMDAVPVSLEEAAWVDGASGLTALRTIVLPLMRQGLGVVFIFVFIQAWGNFFVPFVLLLSEARQPAAVSIFSFFGQHGAVAYGQLAAFSILYSVPVLALYVIVAKGAGSSFALSGAVKG